MTIGLIAILTINRVIGRENTIPWRFSIDIDWFKYHTFNKPVIMGRRTFESIGSKPLPGRRLNIVVSNKLLYSNLSGVMFVNNPIIALSLIKKSEEVMVIGGRSIYSVFLPISDRMYLTYINYMYMYGDTLFPKYNQKEWNLVFNVNKLYRVTKNCYSCLSFKIFNRLSSFCIKN